ncbi:hypothetical protein [Escherichia coli]|uniref:hypothetical protein n=1 Tax=Escherichia coli TaxID=562 RepID=UPI00068A4D78|nr:hypothetical protein [Escherichia coli]EEQ9002737.1 hypothetical protein [Escherichia coli]EER3110215.1 hypothetical protein [Escherichia coli]EEV0718866.1 hypothetical protein [Escherichia coli]EEZ2045131.1 hypothetical protein [Escherichia coli]EFB9334326.1 hypothetical protein [Escherichia coli]
MNMKKSSFLDEGKEPVIERIFRLAERYKSRSEAARAWGINIQTLQNYYKRRNNQPPPQPRKHHLQNIAEKEHVSMEWLIYGYNNESITKKELLEQIERTKKQDVNDGDSIIMRAWDSLTSSEQEILSNLLIRKGAELLTILLDTDIQKLHSLSGVKRALALSLQELPDDTVREIYEECEAKVNHLNVTQKKAGA